MRDHEAISMIYDAGAGEVPWDDALLKLSDALDGATVMLAGGDLRSPGSFRANTARFDTGIWSSIGFSEADQFDPSINPAMIPVATAPVGHVFDRRSFLSDEEFRRDPFLSQLMMGQGLFHTRIVKLIEEHGYTFGGYISVPEQKGPIEGDLLARFEAFMPHLQRAFRLQRNLNEARCQIHGLLDALSGLSRGVVITDGRMRVLTMNALCEKIIARGDGFAVSQGRLTTRDRRSNSKLIQSITGLDIEQSADGFVPVPRDASKLPYGVTVLTAEGTHQSLQLPGAMAILLIHDPEMDDGTPDTKRLEAVFGLTGAEARVARFVPMGLSKAQMASRLGISENTVRSHFKSIREKTRTHSMLELSNRLAHLTGPMPR